jgi:hypothetical protein
MKQFLSIGLVGIMAVMVIASFHLAFSQEQTRPQVTENAVVIFPDNAKWIPCAEGSPKDCEIAVLYGDLAKGNSHILYRVPAGSAYFPKVWHSTSEHGTLIQGKLIGIGKDGKEFTVVPGTYWYIPAGMIHGGIRCSDEGPCMWYESFDKPWDWNVVKEGPTGTEKKQ